MFKKLFGFAIIAFASVEARADIVDITVQGSVIFRSATLGAPLSGVAVGNTGMMTFKVDSNNFVDGAPGDLRSYPIIESSFSLSFQPSGVVVNLLNPFPAGQTPYFTIVDGFPVSDGFFVSSSTLSPGGVPISQTPLQANFDVGYEGNTLSSLNILDAQGNYGFAGLTRFGFNLWQSSPDNVRLEMDFVSMTIQAESIPEPYHAGVLTVAGLLALLCRRK